MAERGWNELHLAAEGPLAPTTAHKLLQGAPVNGNTVSAVLDALGATFDDLFEVVSKSEYARAMEERAAAEAEERTDAVPALAGGEG